MRTLAIAIGLLSMCSNSGLALPASQYSEQSQAWREAYVFAIMEMLAGVVMFEGKTGIDVANGYGSCFRDNNISSTEGVRIVGRYMLRTPDASAKPMTSNVLGAMGETCKAYLPQEQ